jgi:heat shock protein HtpX
MMGIFILLFFVVSYFLGRALGYGLSFVGIFLIISGLMSFVSYYYSDKIVLSMSGAKPANRDAHRALYNSVENLCIASGLPKPKIYVINDPAPNAFATGRDPKHGVVAATTGLLDILSEAELEGVIGHELSHIKNFDTRLMGVTAILAGSIAIIADFFMRSLIFGGIGGDNNNRNSGNAIFIIIGIVAAILAPIAATLIKLAVSRKREYLADASGTLLTRHPEALARALEKIAMDHHKMKNASNATAHLFIENPFKTDTGKTKSFFANLFSTHPPASERVKILRSM